MIVECPKCKAQLAEVMVHKPFIATIHCGMCGVEFGVSLRPEEEEVVPSPSAESGPVPPVTHTTG